MRNAPTSRFCAARCGNGPSPVAYWPAESAVYVVSGRAELWSGDGLRNYTTVQTGDLIYTPPDVAHLPANSSDTDDLVLVLARTEPTEEETLVPMPELDVHAVRPEPAAAGARSS